MSFASNTYTATAAIKRSDLVRLLNELDDDDALEYYRRGGKKGARKRMLSAYLETNIRGSLAK